MKSFRIDMKRKETDLIYASKKHEETKKNIQRIDILCEEVVNYFLIQLTLE